MRIDSDLRTIVAFAISGLLLAGPASADVPDQAAECADQAGSNLFYSQPAGQTFRPTQATLSAVELWIAGANGNPTPDVTITIREDDFAGAVVGSVTQEVTLAFGDATWFRFEFAPALTLTPEATYMIEFDADDPEALLVPSATCPAYDRGEAWYSGSPEEFFDYGFRTFGPCGDGVLDGGEDCDDGTTANPCCLYPTCTFAAEGLACDSGSLCQTAECDGAGTCAGIDGPLPTCGAASVAKLTLSNSDKPGKDKVKFKWIKGEIDLADVGDPASDTDFALCLYDSDNSTITSNVLAANAGWEAKGVKLAYKEKTGAVDSVTAAALKLPIDSAKSGVSISLGGASLDLGAPATYGDPVHVQVQSSAGGCWGATFDAAEVKKNAGTKFVASEKNTP